MDSDDAPTETIPVIRQELEDRFGLSPRLASRVAPYVQSAAAIEIGPRGVKLRDDNGDTEWSLEAVTADDVDRLVGEEALQARMTTCTECGKRNIPWGQEWCYDCQPFNFMHWVMFYSPMGRLWTRIATRGRDGSAGKRTGKHGTGATA